MNYWAPNKITENQLLTSNFTVTIKQTKQTKSIIIPKII